MTKGNNAIPKVHQRKHYHPCSSQKGNMSTFLDQPKKAQTRRRLRLQKAKRIFPRPLKALRPTVACPTVRYNFRKRLGRGFTVEEVRAAGLNPNYAATIGIRVDGRRKNISAESLNANTARLKQYLSKLVLFPLSKKAVRAGEASADEQKKAVQDRSRFGRVVAHPKGVAVAKAPARKVAKADKEKSAYKFLKKNLSAARFLGERIQRAKKREAAAKAAAEKKSGK
jgi:large subunit ribosomal protein L13e